MGNNSSSSYNPVVHIVKTFINSFGTTISNIDDAPLRLDALVMQHGYGSSTELTNKIVSHYVSKVLTQVYKILLSIDMLGNPVGLLGDVGSGVVSFFYEPAMGMMKSPKDFAAGVGKGTKQLLTSSISGVANFGGKIVGSATKLVSHLTFDEKYLKDRAMRQKKEIPKHIGEGLIFGAKDIGRGFYDGITGLVMDPINGFKKNGAKGLGIGVLKGLAGCIVKVSSLLLLVLLPCCRYNILFNFFFISQLFFLSFF
jgi:hypothetical protein